MSRVQSLLVICATALTASPATAATECWSFSFSATNFHSDDTTEAPPQNELVGNFTAQIDWSQPTAMISTKPRTVDLTIAGHAYTVDELGWTYRQAGDAIVLGSRNVVGDVEGGLFVRPGEDLVLLSVPNVRTVASPTFLFYSTRDSRSSWVSSRVSVTAERCPTFEKPENLQGVSASVLCDIGKDILRLRNEIWRSVVLRNRSDRTIPAGTVIAYSTSPSKGAPGALVYVRVERDLLPGAVINGLPTNAGSCTSGTANWTLPERSIRSQ